MGIYRQVEMSFWTDPKVIEGFTPEEKLTYLYLLTNPHTNLAGCYEISKSQMMLEIGFSKQRIVSLIRMLEQKGVIVYSEPTNEILIPKWHKYNWSRSEKFRKPLKGQISSVKNERFRKYLMDVFNGIDTVYAVENERGYSIDTVSDNGGYPIDTTVTVTVTDTVSVTDTDTVSVEEKESERKEMITHIVDYLNDRAGTSYRASSKETASMINAMLNEGYTEEDFYRVIDGRIKAWGSDPKMREYIRPSTLFRPTKFEEYLNAPMPIEKKERKSYMEIAQELEGNDLWI